MAVTIAGSHARARAAIKARKKAGGNTITKPRKAQKARKILPSEYGPNDIILVRWAGRWLDNHDIRWRAEGAMNDVIYRNAMAHRIGENCDKPTRACFTTDREYVFLSTNTGVRGRVQGIGKGVHDGAVKDDEIIRESEYYKPGDREAPEEFVMIDCKPRSIQLDAVDPTLFNELKFRKKTMQRLTTAQSARLRAITMP